MRLISFALTEAQLLDGTKTVTRRQVGSPRSVWHRIKVGDRLRAVDKAMGQLVARVEFDLLPEGVT